MPNSKLQGNIWSACLMALNELGANFERADDTHVFLNYKADCDFDKPEVRQRIARLINMQFALALKVRRIA